MRACFLSQNVCALGYGLAVVQALPAIEPGPTRRDGPRRKSYTARTTNRMVAALPASDGDIASGDDAPGSEA